MFMDIACVLIGKPVDLALLTWGPGSKLLLAKLQSRSLVSMGRDDGLDGRILFDMHDSCVTWADLL